MFGLNLMAPRRIGLRKIGAVMHESFEKSRSARPRRAAPFGYQTPQNNHLEARAPGQVPEALEDWRNKLLASGPNRGVSFEVEFRSKLVIRAFIGGAYTWGRTLILVLRCPLRNYDDLHAVEELLDHYFRTWEAEQ